MTLLSKSSLLAFRQCPRRLWLSRYRPGLDTSANNREQSLRSGKEVGEIARQIYDRRSKGVLIARSSGDLSAPLGRTSVLHSSDQPIFEGALSGGGGIAFADIMLPLRRSGRLAWKIIQVKSSTSLQNHHRDEAAILSCVANAANIDVASISVAHLMVPSNTLAKAIIKDSSLRMT
jgi:hypothetical protein